MILEEDDNLEKLLVKYNYVNETASLGLLIVVETLRNASEYYALSPFSIACPGRKLENLL